MLFTVLVGMAGSVESVGSTELWRALGQFVFTFFGGVVFGCVMGVLIVALRWFSRKDRFAQRAQMIILAYMTFIMPITSCICPPLSIKGMQIVMFWGGLRGAVPIALMLALPECMPGRELIFEMVLAMILFTLLLQGSTTGYLLNVFSLAGKQQESKTELPPALIHWYCTH